MEPAACVIEVPIIPVLGAKKSVASNRSPAVPAPQRVEAPVAEPGLPVAEPGPPPEERLDFADLADESPISDEEDMPPAAEANPMDVSAASAPEVPVIPVITGQSASPNAAVLSREEALAAFCARLRTP